MKTLIPFGFLLILTVCIDAKQSLKGSHHRHLISKLTTRDLQGSCQVDCSGLGVNINYDWVINVNNAGIAIVYQRSQNALGIINFNLKMAVVMVNGLLGIFDIDQGIGLIVNVSSGAATFVSNITNLQSLFFGPTANLISGVSAIIQVMISNASKVASLTLSNVFNVNSMIFDSLGLGAGFIIAAIALKMRIAFTILTNFMNFFTNLARIFLSGGFNIALGALNLVAGIFGVGLGVLGAGFITLAIFIAGSINLGSNIIFSLVHNLLFFVDAIVAGSITAVKLVNNSWQFFSGLAGNLLFTVTLDGMVIINNVVRGTLATFGEIGLGIAHGGQITVSGSASVS